MLTLPSLMPRRVWARLSLRMLALLYALELALARAVRSGSASVGTEVMVAENIAFSVLCIATAVAFCRWFHLAVATADSRGERVGSPGFAVASWFIPGLNLVLPFSIVRRMLPSRDLATRKRVLAWQVTWVIGLLGVIPETMMGIALQAKGFAETPGLLWMTSLSLALMQGRRAVMLSSALLAASVVDRVTRGFALAQG